MKGAKDYLKENNIVPRISFKAQPRHEVVLVDSKPDVMDDGSGGEPKKGVKFLVEEAGEKRTFFAASQSLITRLAEFPEGSKVVITLKSKSVNGVFKSVYEVSEPGDLAESVPPIEDDPPF